MNTSLPPTVKADNIRPLRTLARILKILQSGKSGFRQLAMLALALLFAQTANAATYYITGSGTSFSASKASAGGAAIVNGSNVAIQAAINAIRTDAAGTATTIQFGNGTTVLDIGSAGIEFNGTATPAWGAITLAGKITSGSSNYSSSSTTITLSNGTSISSSADIAVTGYGHSIRAIYNNGTGAVNISGGTVSVSGYYSNSYAVYNASTGTVNISGGTVSVTTDYDLGVAILNASTGTVIVNGGTVASNGQLYTNSNASGTIIAWTNPSGSKTYTAFASNDIIKLPETATAQWLNKDGAAGIDYANGTNTGFIPLAVTVNKATAATPTGLTATYGQTLANVTLPSGWAWESATTTSVGNAGAQTHKAKFTTTDANNYNTLMGIDVGIEVAKIAGIFGTPAAVSTTYAAALTLANVTLPANYVWNAPTTAITAAGNGQTFPATYTDPSGNYNAATGSITVNVAKATDLTATAPPNFMISTSNTSPNTFDLSYIALNKSDHGALTYTLGTFADVGGANKILTAQPTLSGTTLTYTGTGKTSGTATQVINIASDNYANATVTLTFEAIPKTEVTIGSLTAQNYAYDGTPKRGVSGTATSGAYTGALEYIYAGTGIEGISTEPPTNVGSYSLIVQVPETNANYTGYEIYAFTIDKAKIAKPSAASSLAYTGAEQTGIAANAAYTITGNPKATNAGSHTATVALNDKENYEWADGTTADFELAWAIAKAKIAKPTVTTASLVYTGAAQSAGIATNAAYAITNGSATNAGNYTATVSLIDKANREWADGTDSDLELAWAIAKATPATPAGLTATAGQTLANVTLPAGWAWVDATTSVGTAETQTHKANYTPTDATNYNERADIEVTITVSAAVPIFANRENPIIGIIGVQTIGNTILLSNLPANAKVEIYTLQGKRIYSAYPENRVQTKGMYIIKAGSQTMRVAVK